MTDIEQKALALIKPGASCEVNFENISILATAFTRAIEQREATKQELSDYRQEVSDEIQSQPPAVRDYLGHFIIPAPKPDLLVEAMKEIGVIPLAGNLRSALEARGLEIREKGQ